MDCQTCDELLALYKHAVKLCKTAERRCRALGRRRPSAGVGKKDSAETGVPRSRGCSDRALAQGPLTLTNVVRCSRSRHQWRCEMPRCRLFGRAREIRYRPRDCAVQEGQNQTRVSASLSNAPAAESLPAKRLLSGEHRPRNRFRLWIENCTARRSYDDHQCSRAKS